MKGAHQLPRTHTEHYGITMLHLAPDGKAQYGHTLTPFYLGVTASVSLYHIYSDVQCFWHSYINEETLNRVKLLRESSMIKVHLA